MDNVRVVLNFFEHLYGYMRGIAAHIVTGQVYEHYVFGVFFFVGRQFFGKRGVFLVVARTAERAGNRINVCLAIAYLQLCFGR